MVRSTNVDLLVIGGGINGVGIARDASGRGLSVLLCEQGDLAGATSSASSKLIHGGLRYLEQRAFRFVRKALIERELLLSLAPHLVRPARFVLPVDETLRAPWIIGLGLFVYDRLASRRRLPRSERLDLRRCVEGAPLARRLTTGFAYSDCVVDDSRLVVLNAVDARERGAEVLTRTRCRSLRRDGDRWIAELVDLRDGSMCNVCARAVVNAAGPWVSRVQAMAGSHDRGEKLRLVEGGHIIVPRLYAGDHAYILQNDDGRVVFVIPYETTYSLVGTTEVDFAGDPAQAKMAPEEVAYLCRAVSRYFMKPVTADDVMHTFSGVRPLHDDEAASATAVSREFVLGLDIIAGKAPLLTVYGGKITIYRRLAEEAMDRLGPFLTPPRDGAWTDRVPLPGGDFAGADLDRFSRELRAEYPRLPRTMVERLAGAYGTRARKLLGKAREPAELGTDFGAGLTEAEIDYLVAEEWAETGEDVLWRRSKFVLHLSREARDRVARYVETRAAEHRGRGQM